MHNLYFDPVELVDFTEAVAPANWKVFEDRGALVASNGETHFYISENDTGTFTIETNDRDHNSKKNWEADLSTSSFALRYLLITLGRSFSPARATGLGQLMRLEGLPKEASVIAAQRAPGETSSSRDELFFAGDYVGTFRRLGLELHYAGLAAALLPLGLRQIATLFRDGTLPESVKRTPGS